MNNYIINILLLFTFFNNDCFSQKQFSLQVTFNSCLNENKYDFIYIDNFFNKKPSIILKNATYTISGNYENEYCILEVREFKDTTKNATSFSSYFFLINSNSMSIDFNNCDKVDDGYTFRDYMLKNVIDVKPFDKKYFTTIMDEYLGVMNFSDSLNTKSEEGNENVFNEKNIAILRNKNIKLQQKQIGFLLANKSDFYSFWKFKDIALLSKEISPDSLLQIFYQFPDNLINSKNGQVILNIIEGKKISLGSTPTFLNSIDIKKNKILLDNFKGKVLIINFWATWCGPCRIEIPELISLHKKYSENNLKILSISQDTNMQVFNNFIKKNKMDWIHIFNDDSLFKGFAVEGLPKTFVLDENGKIFHISLGNRKGELTEVLSNKFGF